MRSSRIILIFDSNKIPFRKLISNGKCVILEKFEIFRVKIVM